MFRCAVFAGHLFLCFFFFKFSCSSSSSSHFSHNLSALPDHNPLYLLTNEPTMKDLSNHSFPSSNNNSNPSANGFTLRDSMSATLSPSAVANSQDTARAASAPMQRSQILSIIQDVLAIIDDDDEDDFAFPVQAPPLVFQGDRQ
jgi:hypothetical protein